MKTVHFHGELIIVETNEKPSSEYTKVDTKGDFKLADSEVTGNDHMLKVVPGVHVYSNDLVYKFLVETEIDTEIYCKIKNRHTDVTLIGGHSYEIGRANEFNHISRERRGVRD